MAVVFIHDTGLGIFGPRIFGDVYPCPLLFEGFSSPDNGLAGSNMVVSHGLATSKSYPRIFHQGRAAVCHGRRFCHLCGIERFSDFIVILHTSQDCSLPLLELGRAIFCDGDVYIMAQHRWAACVFS